MAQTTSRLERLPLPVRERLEAAVSVIVQAVQPADVILFGSCAAGTPDEGSDVDLLVVADTSEPLQMALELRRALLPIMAGQPFDLVVMPLSDWPRARRLRGSVAQIADRDGVRLHERAA